MKKSERIDHINYWRQSGQTKKAYCELAGIKYATFISWFKKEEPGEVGRFVKVEKVNHSGQGSELEIVFPNGVRLFSTGSITVDLLKKLRSV
ncbi:MAG: IS66 family insertion sequence element accessory protein TnpB [Saprospiraceae bacterium]